VFNPYEPAGAALPPSPSGYADPTGTADATGTQATRRRGGRIGGALAAAGAALAKYGAILYKLKVLATMASVLVSIAAYSLLWGWTFAVGFVVLLAVHESGHALELRRQGIPASAPMFIPFMGAVISMKGRAIDAYHEALVGLAGPAFGAAASLVVGLFASSRHSNFLMALSFVGFFLNLINLFPVLPLDGGRAVGALHPAIWALGLVGLVGVEIWRPNPLVFIVILLGASELWRRWKQRDSIASRLYFNLRPSQRAGIALAYVTLVAVCVIGMNATYLHRTIH
jgi:Zn-dependent protease